jgi:hypothetical protein
MGAKSDGVRQFVGGSHNVIHQLLAIVFNIKIGKRRYAQEQGNPYDEDNFGAEFVGERAGRLCHTGAYPVCWKG